MVNKELLVKIWHCLNEVEKCDKLLEDLEAEGKKTPNESPTLHNAFGEKVGLQLGIPCGKDAHRIFGVATELGVLCINAHRENNVKRAEELEKELLEFLKQGESK